MVDNESRKKSVSKKSISNREKGTPKTKEVSQTESLSEREFASSLQQLLEPALGSALTSDIKQKLLEYYGPNVKLTASKVQSIITPFEHELDIPNDFQGAAYNRFGRAYNRFGRAYNRFGRAYNRFSR